MYVYRAAGMPTSRRRSLSEHRARAHAVSPRTSGVPLDLDIRIRGPRARTARSSARSSRTGAYYERWSLDLGGAGARCVLGGVVGDVGRARRVRGADRRHPLPGRRGRGRGARDQAHQGARGVRAAPAGRRPCSPPSSSAAARSATSEWLVAAAQLRARRRGARAAHHVDPHVLCAAAEGAGLVTERRTRRSCVTRGCSHPGSARR